MVKNKLRELRIARGMSQEELAAAIPCKIGKTVVSLLENGHVLPSPDTLSSMCDIFDCTPVDIYDERDLDLTIANKRGGSLGNPAGVTMTFLVSADLLEAMTEVGYSDPGEWLRASRRKLLQERDMRRISSQISIE